MKRFFASLFKPEPPLLPLLKNLRPESLEAQIMVHRPITEDRAIFLAHIGPTPHGTRGVNYLITKNVLEAKSNIDDLFQKAYDNLSDELDGKGMMGDDGVPLIMLQREGGFAAAAVALPDFYEKACDWVNARQIIAFTPDPDHLLVAAFGTDTARDTLASVPTQKYEGFLDFTPTAFLLDDSSLWIIATSDAA